MLGRRLRASRRCRTALAFASEAILAAVKKKGFMLAVTEERDEEAAGSPLWRASRGKNGKVEAEAGFFLAR